MIIDLEFQKYTIMNTTEVLSRSYNYKPNEMIGAVE